MNHVFRVVWNSRLGIWQAVSEVVRARGKASSTAAAIGLLSCSLLAPAGAHAQTVTGLLVGAGGNGAIPIEGSPGGSGGFGGGGGGGLNGGGGGGLTGSIGGNGGGNDGGLGTASAGGGDTGGSVGGNGSTGTGSSAGSGISSLTQVSGSAASPYQISTSTGYDFVGVGGGGGGGNGNNGGSGAAGYLYVTGPGTTLGVATGMLIGGGGGGAGAGFGGFGGNGGAGTVNVQLGATLSVTGTLQVGGGGGGSGSYDNGTFGGAGGTGTLMVKDASTLSVIGTLQVGGDGGGGGGGVEGGFGGNGGAGTVTVNGFSAVNITGQLVLGGGAGSGVAASGLPGGTGGAGVFNLGLDSSLHFIGTSPAFIINGGSTFNLGDATVNYTTGGTITGLTSLVNDGTINFNQTDTSTISANISGSGSVNQNGSGTTLLTGANTYTGGTTVTGGLIDFNSASSFGTGPITLSGGGLQWATGNTADISPLLNALGVNGGTLDTNSNNVTLASALSGTGGLIVANSGSGGALTLTSSNAYTGKTTINARATLALSGTGSIAASSGVTDNGTFDISGTAAGTSISSLSGAGNVNLGSQTLTLSNASGTFSGVISGSGGLTIATGTETLTNINTYAGTTTIDSPATLVLSSSNDIDIGNVVDFGALEIAGSIGTLSGSGSVSVGSQGLVLSGSNGTFSGVVSGAGGLTLSSSNQTLSGTNTYTGATTIDSDSKLSLSGTGSIANSSGVTDNGTLDISATTNGTSITSLSGSGSVNLGSRSLTLTNAGGTFSGTFTGSGMLTMQGTRSLIFDGNSASFTGATDVASGLLEVGDIDTPTAVLGGDVAVDAAGTLRGHGTITGSVSNDGTVAPGGTIGTLTIGGNYTQASSATLSIEVSPTAASELNVKGSATLNGTLAINYDPGTYSAKSYSLVTASSLAGTFANVSSTGTSYLGTLVPTLFYGASAVDLVLANVADAAPLMIAPKDTSIYTAVGTSAILGAQAEASVMLDRLGRATSATPAQPSGWITATGSQTVVGGTSGEPGFQVGRYGFLAGLDEKRGDYTVGVAAGYGHADINEQNTGDSGTTDTLRAALYGARSVGSVNLAATLGAGLDFLSQKRPFGSEGTAEGDHMGQELNLGTQASLPMALGSVTVTPRIGLRYAYVHANGFGESGAGGENLGVGTDNLHSLQPYADVTLDHAFGDALRPVNVELRLGYAHELLDANRALSVVSQDGTVFSAPGTSLPRGYLTAGAGVTLHPRKNVDVSLSYDGLISTTHASAQQGSIRVGYQF
jgi:fibronectin-binding autotransporter adhesin